VRPRILAFVGVGLLVALLLAAIVSLYASSSPDGLNKAATETGINAEQKDHDLADSPFAGYGTRGVNDDRLATGTAGSIGVLTTFVVAGGLFFVVKRRKTSP
jgi:PDGLE domain